jgi:hypothetical protein
MQCLRQLHRGQQIAPECDPDPRRLGQLLLRVLRNTQALTDHIGQRMRWHEIEVLPAAWRVVICS